LHRCRKRKENYITSSFTVVYFTLFNWYRRTRNAVGEVHEIMHHMGYGVKFLMDDAVREQTDFVVG
jgi:hypothetical protein